MSACPDPIRLVAASAGEDVEALAHAVGCPHCRGQMRDHLALRELSHELPVAGLTRSRRSGLAAAVMVRAEELEVARRLPAAVIVDEPPARSRWRKPIAAVAALAALAAGVALAATTAEPEDEAEPAAPIAMPEHAPSERATAPAYEEVPVPELELPPDEGRPRAAAGRAAMVTAVAGTRWERHPERGSDRIALEDGEVTIEATPAAAPVVVAGDNVRVRATRARLAARAARGVVQQVQVFAGTVEIHGKSGVVVVSAGETWSWDDAPAAATRADLAFRAGWDALRAGDNKRAADLMDSATGDASVGEDATYWAAVARGRAGDKDRAIAGLESFLAKFPSSHRRGEAHLALGRLYGNDPAARRHLEAAATDPEPRVRAAAEALLR